RISSISSRMSSRSFFRSVLEAAPEDCLGSMSWASSWGGVLRRSRAWIAMSASYRRVSAPRMSDVMARSNHLELRLISDPEQGPGSIGVLLLGEVHFVKAGIGAGIAGVIVLLVGLAPTVVGADERSSGRRQALASLVDVQRVGVVTF